ncbi:HYC_CC_PP family protein [Mucilaginibacter pedocola]|uniref:Uncharacterized protein n=1 Tax=Mucilaginibacter pedocola TaxID=1792845 RepID=A0A1S9PER8_9SPHI|nr:hypothetical protein [Mucilaginibacter pedocola]OOQ59433.1 hypothetical protein BC343_04425 [Mucilaginibacter pedocola]
MKRSAVFLLSFFYLLLTTGMFVCFIHCGAKDMAGMRSKVASATKAKISAEHACCRKAANKRKAGGNCCKKHGNYIVKENLQPESSRLLLQAVAIVPQPSFARFFNITQTNSSAVIPVYSHGPPGTSGKSYVIQLRSLLI